MTYKFVIKGEVRGFTADGQPAKVPDLTDELTETLEQKIEDAIDGTDIEIEPEEDEEELPFFNIMITDVEVTPNND